MPRRVLRLLPLVVAPLAFVAASRAEVRTLTDKQGRTIKADVIAVENDVVKIKRDDGRSFDLPLNLLTDEDQAALRDWAKKQESIIPAGAIESVFGRGKFNSVKLPPESVMRSYTDGTQEVAGTINRTNEDWGYNVTLTNRLSRPLKNIRVEYRLFMKPDTAPGNDKGPVALKKTSGSHSIPEIAARSQALFKTTTVRTLKTELRGDVSWAKTGGQGRMSDSLHGIWARIYVGDQLVSETSTPDTLMSKETW